MSLLSPIFTTHPKGKLLLSGEYAVLDGALALAVPTTLGQAFEVHLQDATETLIWESYTSLGEQWFSAQFMTTDFSILQTTNETTARVLVQMLNACRSLNPSFLAEKTGFRVQTKLDFPQNWGLGSSSTLVAALASWAKVSPYPILEASLGGSGYDLACAYAESGIFFRKTQLSEPSVESIDFNPSFSKHLYFVFLEKKQNSRLGIQQYRLAKTDKALLVCQVSILSKAMARAIDLKEFMHHMRQHERLISEVLGEKTVQNRLFYDFDGQIKSLGAWGGDFVLVASESTKETISSYFQAKGYNTCLSYKEMIFNKKSPV